MSPEATTPRDGFSIQVRETREEQAFVECTLDGPGRENEAEGIVRGTDLDAYVVVDTRDPARDLG